MKFFPGDAEAEAVEHWDGFVREFLELFAMTLDESDIERVEWLYRKAFVHGAKHEFQRTERTFSNMVRLYCTNDQEPCKWQSKVGENDA